MISAVHCGQRCPLTASCDCDLLMMANSVCSNTSNKLSTIISTSSCTELSCKQRQTNTVFSIKAENDIQEVLEVKDLYKGRSSLCTSELLLIIEKMLLRIPEQMRSSFCCLRCRWIWCRTTGSRILLDSVDKETQRLIKMFVTVSDVTELILIKK